MKSPLNKNHKVTSPYGRRILGGKSEMHNGIDLVPADGGHPADLFAVADGVVDDIRSIVPDSHTGLRVTTMVTGNFVNIKTNDGYLVIYRHLKAGSIPENIKKGADIKAGDKIGVMGTTGQSTGVHLHYELRNPKGEAFDPAPYINTDKILGNNNPSIQEQAQSAAPTQTNADLKAGDKIMLKSGAKTYTGGNIGTWVFGDAWIVLQIKGDRVVIDKNASGTNAIMTPVNIKDLIKS